MVVVIWVDVDVVGGCEGFFFFPFFFLCCCLWLRWFWLVASGGDGGWLWWLCYGWMWMWWVDVRCPLFFFLLVVCGYGRSS